MKNPKPDFVIEIHVGEPTADGKCSVCEGELTRTAGGNSTVGSTRAFRDGYDQIDWSGFKESVRKAQKAYLN